MASIPPPLPSSEPSIYQPDWAPWVRQFISIGLVIAGVWALTLLTPVITILITTFLLSFLMFVPARVVAWRTPLTYPVCVLIMFLIVLLLIILLVLVIVPAFVDLAQNVIESVNRALISVQDTLNAWDPSNPDTTQFFVNLPLGIQFDATQLALPLKELIAGSDNPETALLDLQAALFSLLPVNINVGAVASSVANTVGSVALWLVGTVGNLMSTLTVSLLLSLVILLELPRYQTGALEGFPRHQRELRLLGQKIMNVWTGFFRGQLFLCFIIGVMTYLQLMLTGVPSAFIVSVIVAVISLIPTIGGIIALIPLFIMPLIQGSTVLPFDPITMAIVTVLVNLVISQVIWNVIAPKVMGDAVNLPLPLIILGIIIGAAVGGALGAFLIVPILGMVRVLIAYLMAKVARRDPYPGEEMPAVIELAEI